MAYDKNKWADMAAISRAASRADPELSEDGPARELTCFTLIGAIVHELERSEMFADSIERAMGDYLFPSLAKGQGDSGPVEAPPSRLVADLDNLRHRLERHANKLMEIKERIQ